MKKMFFLLLMLFSTVCFGQTKNDSLSILEKDTIHYEKTIEYAEKRAFEEDLKEKYNDKEFQYTEEEEKEEQEEEEEKKEDHSSTDDAFVAMFLFFISKIFPFLLGVLIIFIILKTFLGTETNFWNFKKTK